MNPEPVVNVRPKVRRNGACRFCASGRKFKKCCGAPTRVTMPEGVLVGARFAGKAHERPALFAYDKVVSLDAIPFTGGA